MFSNSRHRALTKAIRDCEKCGKKVCCVKLKDIRGSKSAQILMVTASPMKNECQRGYPLSNKMARVFHTILSRTAGIDTNEDVLVTSLVQCNQRNRQRIAPSVVKNCWPIFTEVLCALRPKVIVALGGAVAAHIANRGSTIPQSMYGRSIVVNNYHVFTFHDPEFLREDFDAKGWNGEPMTDSFWHERFYNEAREFKKLLTRLGMRKKHV